MVVAITVVFAMSSGSTSLSSSTVTYGGVSMTSVGRKWYGDVSTISSASNTGFVEIFVLSNPSSGSQTVSATVSIDSAGGGTRTIYLAANSTSHANAGGYIDTLQTTTSFAAGTSMSQSVSSAAGRRVFHVFSANGATAYNHAQRTSTTLSGIVTIYGDAEGDTSMSFTGTRTSAVAYVGVALEIVPAAPVPGRVYFDALGAGNNLLTSAAGTISGTHVVNGDALIVFVNQEIFSSTRGTLTVSAGGTPMTELGTVAYLPNVGSSGYYNYLTVFGLLNPPKGSITVTATNEKSSYAWLDSLSYHNVHSFDAVATNSGTGTSATISVASRPTQMVVQSFAGYTTAMTAYTKSQRTVRPYVPNVSLSGVIGEAPGDSSLAYAATTGTGFGALAVPMNPKIAAPVRSSIIFDAVGAGVNSQSANPSWSHTIDGNCLLVGVHWQIFSGSYQPTSVTVGGTPLTRLSAITPLYYYYWDGSWAICTALYGLMNPPQGSQTIQVNLAGTQYLTANSISYKNVRGFGLAQEGGVLNGTGSTQTGRVVSAPDQRVVHFVGATGVLGTFSHTQRWQVSYNSGTPMGGLFGDAPGDSVVNLNTATPAAQYWGTNSVPLLSYRTGQGLPAITGGRVNTAMEMGAMPLDMETGS